MHTFISVLTQTEHFNSNFVKLKILQITLNEIKYAQPTKCFK